MCVVRPHIYGGRMCVRSCHLSLCEWGPSERQEACGSASCFLCWYSALDPVSLRLFNVFMCRIRGLIFARWFCRSAALGLCRPHMHHVAWLDVRKFRLNLSKIRFKVLFEYTCLIYHSYYRGLSLKFCRHTHSARFFHTFLPLIFLLNFPLPCLCQALSLFLSLSCPSLSFTQLWVRVAFVLSISRSS